jgi:hypothetical protein
MSGLIIGNGREMIKLTKGETKLAFDKRSYIKGGFLSGIKMVSVLNQVTNTVFETKKMIKSMSVHINKLHKIVGHCGKTRLTATANVYGIKVFRKLEAYESCDISKAKQKKNNKVCTGLNKVPG